MAALACAQMSSIKAAGLIPLSDVKATKSIRTQLALRSQFAGQQVLGRATSCRHILRCNRRVVATAEKHEEQVPVKQHGLTRFQSLQSKVADVLPELPRMASSCLTEAVRFIQKPAVIATLVAAVMLSTPDFAMAAQGGGRVGGKNFSSGSSYPSQTYSAPVQTYVAPSFSAPYYAPSPFFGGWSPFGFYNPGPTIVVGGGGFGFGGLFGILLIGAVLMFVANTVFGFLGDSDDGVYTEKTSVTRLQVGLLGMARTLQKDLDNIAERADTESPEGLHYILTETVLALLRHPDYCVYGRSTAEVGRTDDGGEAAFNSLSLEERGKFQQETLVSVDSIRRRVNRPPRAERFTSEYIVVTILVAAEGEFKLPAINSTADLKQALTTLGSIPVDQLRAVEILWTPQDEDDTLSAQDMLADYPQLRAL